jgi:CheY-like chemotaxis protein
MGPGVNLLLVDDNPCIRELLLQSLTPLAEVKACGSATEALRQAEQQVPDLVVCDYRMPGCSGLELLTEFSSAFPQSAVVMLASRADIAGPLAGASARVEEFIEKPFFVEEATARIKRVINRVVLAKASRESKDSSSFRGTLAQMSVVDLVQTLDIGRKSCRLVLSREGDRCELQFHDGQLVHATLGDLTGEAVMYVVVGWHEGAFQINFENIDCPHTITHSTQSVLMEALRRFDEAQRDSAVPKHPPKTAGVPSFASTGGF